MSTCTMSIGVVIPIYRPGPIFNEVLNSLQNQTYLVSKIVIINSGPEPWNGQEYLKQSIIKTELLRIPFSEFDHGGTRNLGASIVSDTDAIMFLTQDAILAEDCLENMVNFMQNNSLSATFARQLPRDGSTEIEKFERKFNYPESSKVKSGIPTSIDDVFFSDVCSLVKTTEFIKIGRFPDKIITAEDMILAVRMRNAGDKVGYCSEAKVKHSHQLEFLDTLRRYFDFGVMHSMWKNYIPAKTVAGKGRTFVLEGMKHISIRSPWEILHFSKSVTAKAIGYYLGKRYTLIPERYRSILSSNKAFWLKGNNCHTKSN